MADGPDGRATEQPKHRRRDPWVDLRMSKSPPPQGQDPKPQHQNGKLTEMYNQANADQRLPQNFFCTLPGDPLFEDPEATFKPTISPMSQKLAQRKRQVDENHTVFDRLYEIRLLQSVIASQNKAKQ